MSVFAVIVISIWMLAGGVAHMLAPEAFFPIVPDWMPELAVVYGSGVVELAIGLGVLWRRTRAVAGLSFALLCAGFLPLHLWDFFRPDPIFSPWYAAATRCVVQLGLIGLGLLLWARRENATPRV